MVRFPRPPDRSGGPNGRKPNRRLGRSPLDTTRWSEATASLKLGIVTSRALLLVPAALALAGLGALCPREARGPEVGVPAGEVKLAALSAQLSEPGGYFDTDNLISNETSYLQVADRLAEA